MWYEIVIWNCIDNQQSSGIRIEIILIVSPLFICNCSAFFIKCSRGYLTVSTPSKWLASTPPPTWPAPTVVNSLFMNPRNIINCGGRGEQGVGWSAAAVCVSAEIHKQNSTTAGLVHIGGGTQRSHIIVDTQIMITPTVCSEYFSTRTLFRLPCDSWLSGPTLAVEWKTYPACYTILSALLASENTISSLR